MKCDNCGEEQKNVFPNAPDDCGWDKQIDNGLVIRVCDGYGMFTDILPITNWDDDRPFEMVFCHDCCVKLFDEFPAFVKKVAEIDPYSSSAHTRPAGAGMLPYYEEHHGHHPCSIPCKYGYKA